MSSRRRTAAGLATALIVLLALPVASPLGPLAGTMTLVLVLPPLAQALVQLGWSGRVARGVARQSATAAVLLPYAAWLAISAALTLDVAAVVAAPVSLELAALNGRGRRMQLWAAIVGSNVGSLLFPFSNLTNLLVVSGTGIGFAAYVEHALAPQLALIIAAGAILAWRARATTRTATPASRGPSEEPSPALPLDRAARYGGLIAAGGALGAILAGLAGGDVAIPFAVTAALLAGLAVGTRRVAPRDLVTSVPMTGVAVVLLAAVTREPALELATGLPSPAALLPGPVAVLVACLVGGSLAALVNNLPAAAFGAVWLVGSPVGLILAFLVGTNVVALATPHGSLATILVRSIAARAGHPLAPRAYVRAAWRYAGLPALAALAAIVLVR